MKKDEIKDLIKIIVTTVVGVIFISQVPTFVEFLVSKAP